MDVAVVIPNYNGARWLPGVLASVAAQTVAPAEVLVVDDGSTDDSAALAEAAGARVLRLGRNGGFARAANAGVAAVGAEAVALVNTDVVLDAGLARARGGRAEARPTARWRRSCSTSTTRRSSTAPATCCGATACASSAGASSATAARYDEPGEVFSACAGAALYRRVAVLGAGGFDERLGMYLEDVELGLRLRLAGWSCAWEPRAVARHAGAGSSGGPGALIERNTLLLVARHFRAALAPAGRLPPARVGVARGARRAAARAPGGRADGAAAAARVPARPAALAADRRGHPGAADPRAPRRRPPVAARGLARFRRPRTTRSSPSAIVSGRFASPSRLRRLRPRGRTRRRSARPARAIQ